MKWFLSKFELQNDYLYRKNLFTTDDVSESFQKILYFLADKTTQNTGVGIVLEILSIE